MVLEGYLLAGAALLLLFISLSLHHRAFYQIFEQILSQLNFIENKRDDSKFLLKLHIFHNTTKG